jgi:hypothetical protein
MIQQHLGRNMVEAFAWSTAITALSLSPIFVNGLQRMPSAASDDWTHVIVIGFDSHVFESPLCELSCHAHGEVILGNGHALL